MTRQQFAKIKADFIAKKQKLLLKTVSVAEKALYNEILDKFINELELSDGKVISNDKNIDIATSVDKLFKSFNKTGYVDIIKQFTGDLFSVTKQNAEYFRILGEAKERIPQAEEKANDRLKKQLGINEKGRIKTGGYLDRLINDKDVAKQVKKALYKGIAGNVDLKTIQDDLKFVLEGNDKVNGALTRHLNTNLMDAYQAHDRISGNEFAVAIELNAAFFSGGLRATSRCFCKSKKGKVFTREEMSQWKTILNTDCGPIWNEEKDGTYIGIERIGGYGCVDTLDWISNSEAIRRRPELKSKL